MATPEKPEPNIPTLFHIKSQPHSSKSKTTKSQCSSKKKTHKRRRERNAPSLEGAGAGEGLPSALMEEGMPRASTRASTPITIKLFLNTSISIFNSSCFPFSSFVLLSHSGVGRRCNLLKPTQRRLLGGGCWWGWWVVYMRNVFRGEGNLKRNRQPESFPILEPLDCYHVFSINNGCTFSSRHCWAVYSSISSIDCPLLHMLSWLAVRIFMCVFKIFFIPIIPVWRANVIFYSGK